MKTYTSEEIKKIAVRHLAWLRNEAGGERADFSNANFSGADFSCADFSYADFSGADFSNADLSDANLRGADFSYADFSDADLRGADFRYANFRGADLRGADLRCADFSYADFGDAVGNGKEIVSYTSCWTVVMRHGMIRIGCKEYKAAKWKSFSDEEIAKMDNAALKWWRVHKIIVLSIYEAHFGEIEEVTND